jgi:NDP-4-keto-2,6-dideoxyhexose 3-C-methyltransferase
MMEALKSCRACGAERLQPVLDLGRQALSGMFPRPGRTVPTGPVELVRCLGRCGLLQLAHTCDLSLLYGMEYGYRSGLNPNMAAHLQERVERVRAIARPVDGDLIVDIGSNDGTTLRAWGDRFDLVGIDPSGPKFRKFYPPNVRLIPDFFPSAASRAQLEGRRAKVITSFAMFYDVPDPAGFMREIASLLEDDGVWMFEQSYMPAMLATNSFDTVCHEHLEYYGLRQIVDLAEGAGLRVLDVEFNDTNGGSFSVVAARKGSRHPGNEEVVARVLQEETRQGLDQDVPYVAFSRRVEEVCAAILGFLREARAAGKRVYGLGASTKGNILMQRAGIGPDLVTAMGDVNPDKFGCVTPGTGIPIIPEDEMLACRPDYVLVLLWHYRKFFLSSPKFAGRTLVFPLPQLDIVR